MDRLNRILRAASAALVAALMAGCTAHVAVCALGFKVSWLPVYAAALAAALAVQVGRRSMAWGIASAAVLAGGFGLLLADGAGEIAALVRNAVESRGLEAGELAAHASAGRSIALLAALAVGALCSLLMKSPSDLPVALLLLLAAVICGLAVNEDLSLWIAVPGLAAGAAAFGLSAGGRRASLRPGLVVPAAAVVLIALLLVPAQRVTWEPLESFANRLRSVMEDYLHFTEERMAFSIHDEGYDRAGIIGDSVVAMLGGPANPDAAAVMRVETDEDLLLRGTIKRSYTGYSWIDDQVKARYLYYDFTHRGARDDVFSANTGDGSAYFRSAEASVEMLDGGTSTLFVPALLSGFSMDLADAVYYNSEGEIFLTRDVEPGDSYAVSTRLPVSEAALIAAASDALARPDERYGQMLDSYTALPGGIDQKVYALAIELSQNQPSAAEKALAIQKYLMENCRYTLDGGYPHPSRDFVSWFLLEEKQGYCSYFASAMTVLCRIAGLPARYVEGYFVPAEPDGETIVTGENAHAWVEVYLHGLGWTAFDPTARSFESGQQGGNTPDDGSFTEDGSEETPFGNDDTIDEAPDATPTPDIGSDPGSDPTPDPDIGDSEPTPTPSPEPEDDALGGGDPEEDSDVSDDNSDGEDDPADDPGSKPEEESPEKDTEKKRSNTLLWILLILLLLAAVAALTVLWARRRLRLSDPLKLCVATRSGQTAAMILYRGILTLLVQAGLVPQSGETPEQFAARAVQTLPNPAYEGFVADVVHSRYSGKALTRETLEAGRRAYVRFLNEMHPGERLRYHLRRMLHGIGDLENIP